MHPLADSELLVSSLVRFRISIRSSISVAASMFEPGFSNSSVFLPSRLRLGVTRVGKGLDLEAKIDEVDSVDVDTEVVEFNARELDGLLFLQQASFVNVATTACTCKLT